MMMRNTLLLLLLAGALGARAGGDYRNPVIYADVPDMSVCHAGDYYYMVSTTMNLMPGAPIMRSRDMQTWETVSYVFPSINDGPRYDLVGGQTAYGQGQWASSIRHHDGQFYVWFGANGEPGRGFIYSAPRAEGPWTLVARPPHHHDASLFFDDDGRVYLFHGTGRLTELRPDLTDVLPGGVDTVLFERDADEQGLLEGSQVVKRNGMYYLLMISMDWSIEGRLRRQVCYRAPHILGPYEKRVILETDFEGYGGAGQGCIVDDGQDHWQGLIFQDRVGVGRVPCLMPCTWVDGWPMLGDEDGRIPTNRDLPHQDLSGICGSDDFAAPQLSLYWQWNHNPVDGAWSLTERPGALRLRTCRVVDNLFVAPNTLTQRMAGPRCTGTVTLDISHMRDGDRAGLASFNSEGGVLTIEKEGGKTWLTATVQNSVFAEPQHSIASAEVTEQERIRLKAKQVWLRIEADFTCDTAYLAYSTDGVTYRRIGGPTPMGFDYTRMFMGQKFAIFNYATRATGGYVDVLNFDYQHHR